MSWVAVLSLVGCAATQPSSPSGHAGPPGVGTSAVVAAASDPGESTYSGLTCDEVVTEFAAQLTRRLDWVASAGGTGPAVVARLRATVEPLAMGAVDHLFAVGLGGECRYAEFAEAFAPMLSSEAMAVAETPEYSMFDRLAYLMSAMEVDERSERLPPVPINPVPGFGDGPWGPLAVIRSDAGDSDLAGFSGALRIGARCVTVGGSTMVFRSGQVAWNPDNRSITFWDPASDIALELHHGDYVSFGGGGFIPMVEPDWASAPDPSCPMAEAFAVGMLGALNGIRLTELRAGSD